MGTLFGRPVYIISIYFNLSNGGTLLMGTKSSSPGGVPISEVPLYNNSIELLGLKIRCHRRGRNSTKQLFNCIIKCLLLSLHVFKGEKVTKILLLLFNICYHLNSRKHENGARISIVSQKLNRKNSQIRANF